MMMMMTKLPTTTSLLLLLSLSPVVVVSNEEAVGNFVSSRVDMVDLGKQLLAPLGVLLKEAVKEADRMLPGGGLLEEGVTVGECCRPGDVGAKLKLGLFGFDLEDVDTERQISVRVKETAEDGVVGVRGHGRSLRVSAGVAATLGLAALIPFECTVRTKATLVMERYSVDFNVDPNDSKRKGRFYVHDIDEGDARVVIAPKLSGSCAPVETLVVKVFDRMSNLLTKAFRNVFAFRMTEFITDQINNLMDFVVPSTFKIDLGTNNLLPGRRLEVVPSLDFVATNELSTDWEASGRFEAFLDEPEWRRGMSFHYGDYANDADDNKRMPPPNLEHAFNLHVGARAVSSLVQTVWYVAASKLTENDEASARSPLCADHASSDTDPCPFLPFRRAFSPLQPGYWVSLIMFPCTGLFSGYEMQSLLTPPRVDFTTDGVEGEGAVDMMVKGTSSSSGSEKEDDGKVLVRLKGTYTVEGGLPGFDYDTGRFNILRLDGVYLRDVEIDFPSSPPILNSLSSLMVNTVVGATNLVTGTLLTILNDVVEEVLNGLPSLLVPTVGKFPLAAGFLEYYLPVGGLKTVPATETEASYVQVWGDLGTRALGGKEDEEEEGTDGDGDGNGDGGEDGEEEHYGYEYYKRRAVRDPESYCETAKKWAEESNNPQATFSCIFEGEDAEREETYRVDQ